MFNRFYIRLNVGLSEPVLIEVNHDIDYGVIYLQQKGNDDRRGHIVRTDTHGMYQSAADSTITCSRSEMSMVLGELLKSALTPGGVDVGAATVLAAPDTEDGTSPMIYARNNAFDEGVQLCGLSDTGFFSIELEDHVPNPVEFDSTDEVGDKTNPKHYQFSNGSQLIDITENLDFCSGNAIKYIARSGNKYGETRMDDLLKAQWYLNRLIDKESENGN